MADPLMTVTIQAKDFFFDRPVVERAVDKATHRALSRSLAFVRKSQKSSIRRRKKPSEPGKPPSAHSRDPVASVKNILFAYDRRSKYGIVGMVNLNGRRSMVQSSKELPELLEFGGPMTITEIQSSWSGSWWAPSPRALKTIARKYPGVNKRKRNARMRPRPSAGPALEREAAAGNILSPWANVVSGT